MTDACPQCGKSKFAPNDTEWMKNNRRTCYNCGFELVAKPAPKKQRTPKHLRGRSNQPEQKRRRETVQCGECMSEGLHPDARRCPHCGVQFETAADHIDGYVLILIAITFIILMLGLGSL